MRSSPWSSPLACASENGKAQGASSLTHAFFWNALEAIEGFNINSLQGELNFVPHIPGDWRSLRVPIFTPTFWGSMEFKPTAKGELITFRLDRLFALPSVTPSRKFSIRAVLALSVVRIPGPPSRPAGSAPLPSPVAHVSLGRVPIGVKTFGETDGSLRLVFETPLTMSAGDRLEIDLH